MTTTDDPRRARHYAAILFDLFGTLVRVDVGRFPVHRGADGAEVRSTAPIILEACRRYGLDVSEAKLWEALRAASEGLREECEPNVEIPSRERFRRAILSLEYPADRAEQLAVLISRTHLAAITAAASVPQTHRAVLQEARRHGRVGIVSNFDDTAAAYGLLARVGLLEMVDTVVVSEAVGRRKPHPLPLLVALDTLGVDSSEALYVGDSHRADVGVARAVGCDVAWIDGANAGSQAEGSPTYTLRVLPDLPERLGWIV